LVQNVTTKPRKSSSATTTPAATTTTDGGGGGGGGDEATLVLKKLQRSPSSKIQKRVKEFEFVNFFSRGLTSSYEHRLVRPLVPHTMQLSTTCRHKTHFLSFFSSLFLFDF